MDVEPIKEELTQLLSYGGAPEDEFDKGYNLGIERALELIDAAPTVEQPKGKWINIETSVNGYDGQAECNLCGCIVHNNFSKAVNFCPNCGAKMKGGEET